MKVFATSHKIVSLENISSVICEEGNAKDSYAIRIRYQGQTDPYATERILCGNGKNNGKERMEDYFTKILEILKED